MCSPPGTRSLTRSSGANRSTPDRGSRPGAPKRGMTSAMPHLHVHAGDGEDVGAQVGGAADVLHDHARELLQALLGVEAQPGGLAELPLGGVVAFDDVAELHGAEQAGDVVDGAVAVGAGETGDDAQRAALSGAVGVVAAAGAQPDLDVHDLVRVD